MTSEPFRNSALIPAAARLEGSSVSEQSDLTNLRERPAGAVSCLNGCGISRERLTGRCRGNLHGFHWAHAESRRPRRVGAVNRAAVAAESYHVFGPQEEGRRHVSAGQPREAVTKGTALACLAESIWFWCFSDDGKQRFRLWLGDRRVSILFWGSTMSLGSFKRFVAVDRQRGFMHWPIGVQVQAPANVAVTVTRWGETQVWQVLGSVLKHVLCRLIELTEQAFGHSDGTGALGETISA